MSKPWLAHYEQGVPHIIAYPEMTLPQLLQSRVERYGDRPAMRLLARSSIGAETLTTLGGSAALQGGLTYGQLMVQVDRFAVALGSLGIQPGDRVALLLPNLLEFVISYFGALKAGAIVVCANPTHTARELTRQFADAGVGAVVLEASAHEKIREVQATVPLRRLIVADLAAPAGTAMIARDDLHSFSQLLAAQPRREPAAHGATPDDVALLQYTGGTMGAPRAAVLTHRNLVANAIQMRSWMSALPDGSERVVASLPLFHVYGMTVAMNVAFCMGAELLLLPDPRDVGFLMEVLEAQQASVFPGVPTTYVAIVNHPDVAGFNLRSVKACISGAAPLPADTQLRFGELTGGRLVEGYGLTEASPVTHCTPIFGESRIGSMGLPLPDTEAKIVDPVTLTGLPAGQQGELWVRGPQVMRGYWNRPEETTHTITPDRWLRTGDIAYMDSGGYFRIVDRLKDIIITSGFNVVPREVEEVLYEHPKVREAAVAGLPDPRRGELVKAYIVLRLGETATPEEITSFCHDKLAPYKIPSRVEFRSFLPKTTVGKVLRRLLVEEEQLGDSKESR